MRRWSCSGQLISLSRRPPDWSEIPKLIDRVALVSGESIATVNGARLSLRIERLYLTKGGFQLPVSVSYDDNRPTGDRVVRLDFREIDIVQDDLGNHYLPSTRSGAGSLTRGVARWELSCYPALAPEARQLTVGFSDAIVAIESQRDLVARMETRPSKPFDGPTVAFGELLVTIPLIEPNS